MGVIKNPILKIILKLSLFFTIFTIFTFQAYISIDPDFGWHLKYGETIAHSGFPRYDTFSYTMSSYEFISHEWLTDLIFYYVYTHIGFGGLAILFGGLTTLALAISTKLLNLKTFAVLFLATSILLPFSGVRPQVITLVFLSLLIKVSLDQKNWTRFGKYIPLLFLPWTSLHGGFAVGLAVLFFLAAVKFLIQRRIKRNDIIIISASFLVTLVNPFGLKIWYEVWMTISELSLRSHVVEWMSIFQDFNLVYRIPLIVFISISLYLFKDLFKQKKPAVLLAIFFLLAGILSRRHLPLFVLSSLPLISLALKKRLDSKLILMVFSAFIFALSIYQINKDLSLSRQKMESFQYPKNALSFLNRVNIQGQIFSNYSWGGYLIWKLPDKKVFIDGRMTTWRRNSAPPSEANRAQDEYFMILDDYKAEEIFNKYNITTVLWPSSNLNINKASVKSKMIEEQEVKFLKTLLDKGWKVVYQDTVSIIIMKDYPIYKILKI